MVLLNVNDNCTNDIMRKKNILNNFKANLSTNFGFHKDFVSLFENYEICII